MRPAGIDAVGSGAPDQAALVDPAEAGRLAHGVLDAVERAIVGKRDALELVLCGILASGHVLIEDLPGLGKTLMARSFAAALGLSFTRIQFTPDLLPADVTGAGVYDQATGTVAFRPGPVFSQLLLADEINRTPPKTQAALLEAMGEGQVSVDGTTRALPQPFIVLATDNPIEYEGTYPLPEAQLDRFLLRVRLGYLPRGGEVAMLQRRLERGSAPPRVPRVVQAATLLAMREALERVRAEQDVLDYIVRLLEATRQHPQVAVGASPRGGLALVALARARAVLAGRDFVLPEDVKALAAPALAHRLTLRPEVWVRRIDGEQIVRDLLSTVPTPATEPGS